MSKICFNKSYFILSVIIIIIISFLGIDRYIKNFHCPHIESEKKYERTEVNFEENSLENSSENSSENSLENVENMMNPVVVVDRSQTINRSPKQINSLDRIYNPLRYPYKSDYYYDQRWYPNLLLPPQVIGGGYRRQPTLGGTEVPIVNPALPINITNNNIAPVNITTRGPLGNPQQVGNLYKIYGDHNDVLPLFGRRRYPNDNRYDYYTITGQWGTKVKVITKNRNDELGTNDVVFLQGFKSPFRVTIFESDFPQYIPYY